jgi:hypothetical protein
MRKVKVLKHNVKVSWKITCRCGRKHSARAGQKIRCTCGNVYRL